MAVGYKIPRGTRAALDAKASGATLVVGQPYLITDENRIAVALTTSTYQTYAKQSELGLSSSLVFVIDGAGSVIAANSAVDLPDIPFGGTVTGWTITSDVSGSAVVDIRRATYSGFPTFSSIAGSELPTLSSAQKNQDLSLTTWTTSLAQGDVLRAIVNSASTVKKLSITLRITRTV
jgi:hypothetical protein